MRRNSFTSEWVLLHLTTLGIVWFLISNARTVMRERIVSQTLLSTNSVKVTMPLLLQITILHTKPQTCIFSRDATSTWKTSAHLLCAPCRRICRGCCRYHADMSVVVPITLSRRPRVTAGHKVTLNISTTDIAAGTHTYFVGACTPARSPRLDA
jgi:hypothetical protein